MPSLIVKNVLVLREYCLDRVPSNKKLPYILRFRESFVTEIRRVLEFLNDLDFDIDAREYEMCVDLPEASFAHRTRPLLQQLVKVHGPALSPPGFELLLRKVTQRIFATLESILFFHDGGTGGAAGGSSMAGLVMGMDDREFMHPGPSGTIGSKSGSDGNNDFGGTDCISQFGALKLANDVRLFMVRVEHWQPHLLCLCTT